VIDGKEILGWGDRILFHFSKQSLWIWADGCSQNGSIRKEVDFSPRAGDL